MSVEKEKIRQKGQQIVVNAPQLYIDVDIEADGIAGYGSMLALGAQSSFGEIFYSEIKPESELFIKEHRKFCEAHNLERERLLVQAPDYRWVMKQFKYWLADLSETHRKKDLVFTAFNAAFDWGFVDLYFLKSGIKNPFGIAPLDLKSLALPLTKNWNWRQTAKAKLPEIIIPEGDFTHHALEDAQYQQKIHFGLAGLLGNRNYLENTIKLNEEGRK